MKKIAVIIPAYNEEDDIKGTIEALRVNSSLNIIVVDNGSTDATVEIASGLGVRVVNQPQGTIAAVRNYGVAGSEGDILVFVDADVRVTPDWHKHLPSVIEELSENPMLVTGSRCSPPNSNGLINRYWYSKLSSYSATYINSAHLITTRALFKKIDGFTEDLETAEDYDFCRKATLIDAEIRSKPELKVIHEGYPQTLIGFIKRERWHGRQDVNTWSSFLNSKMAWVASFNLILFFCAVAASFVGVLMAIPTYLVVMYLVSLLLSVIKFGMMRIDSLILTPVFFYFYLCGRSLSIIDKLLGAAAR